MNKPRGQVCMKFMLQHSIFITYISYRGNHGDVPAACAEGPFFSQVLGGSVTLELLRMFSGLICAWKEGALCGGCLL